jgi:uncharacterized protein YfaS (alpha-2-macroglobulin family)
VIDRLPIVRVSGPTTGQRFETLTFHAEAVAADGASIASMTWDLGDGVVAGAGASATASFRDVGGFHPRVTVTDSLGRTKSQALGVTVWDDVEADLSFDVSPLMPHEKATGDVVVRFADGAPVRGATLTIEIDRGTGNPALDELLEALPAFVRRQLGTFSFTISGTTASDGTFSFEVPYSHVIEHPDDDGEPVELNHVGLYSAQLTGHARGSPFAPAHAAYEVVASLPGSR